MVENKDALENVERIFAKYNRPLLEINKLAGAGTCQLRGCT
jgi:nicotinamide-nucleotide amidase